MPSVSARKENASLGAICELGERPTRCYLRSCQLHDGSRAPSIASQSAFLIQLRAPRSSRPFGEMTAQPAHELTTRRRRGEIGIFMSA